jgi:hypothetical protein
MINKYAKINSNNIVENVIDCEDSQIGSQNGYHVKVTEDTREGKIGSTYDSVNNKFIDVKPFESWTFNETSFEWESPLGPKPEGKDFWREDLQEWKTLGA